MGGFDEHSAGAKKKKFGAPVEMEGGGGQGKISKEKKIFFFF